MSYEGTQVKVKNKLVRIIIDDKKPHDDEYIEQNKGFDYKIILVGIFALLSSAAPILGNMTPFGFPLASYIIFYQKKYSKMMLLCIPGIMMYGGITAGIRFLVFFVILMAVSKWKKNTMTIFATAIACGFTAALTGAIVSYISNATALEFAYTLSEGALTFSMFYVYYTAMNSLLHIKEKNVFTPQEVICFSLILSISIAGLSFAVIYDISIAMVFSVFGILFAGYYFGLGASLSFAVLSGFFLTVSGELPSTIITVLCFCALLSTLVTKLEKIVMVLLFTAANGLCTYFVSGYDGISANIAACIAGGIIFIAAASIFGDKLIEEKKNISAKPVIMNDAVSRMVKEEIELQKSMITEISNNLSEFEYKELENPARNICKIISSDVCCGCNLYGRCWHEEADATYSNFVEVINSYIKNPTIEYDRLPSRFLGMCSKSFMMFKMVAYIYDSLYLKQNFQLKLNRFKKLMNEQFKHLNRVLDKLYQQLSKGIYVNIEQSASAAAALQSSGIAVNKILVVEDFNKQQKIFVKTKEILAEEIIKNEIPDVLSDILDKEIVYDYSLNRRKDDQDYNYSYTEEYPYKLSIGLSRCCKEEYSYSGDNNSNVILSNGLHMIALCDGMGSGTVASHQSTRVLNMLEELLNSGCDENSAINIINSILVLEEGEEIFSTLDLFLFDLNKCVGEFVKAGASPTYVRRGYNIEKIDFDTLPVGILEDVHIHTGIRNFERGDYIYFMSDGFLDSIMNDETYLMQQILQHDYRNPQKIADALFEDALRFASGKAVDDITIMVVKIR